MKEIVKHINDTNASYRTMGAGDAKNTDLFLDNEHFELFKDCGEQITVRFDKENLSKAILFIASILPRKYDCSATHTVINYSVDFVLEQLAILDGFFMVDGRSVNKRTQVWNARKDVEKKNGEIDPRFYFNGLICDVLYSYKGTQKLGKFTLRNYLAGAYSNIKIAKANDGVFDIFVTNALTPDNEGFQENIHVEDALDLSLQQIFYGAPGTGKSFTIEKIIKGHDVIRTTFHPDSDYSTFVGCYKPVSKMKNTLISSLTLDELAAILSQEYSKASNKVLSLYVFYFTYAESIKRVNTKELLTKAGLSDAYSAEFTKAGNIYTFYKMKNLGETNISYTFVPQAFTKAYVKAWSNLEKPVFLVIEEINRGNCAQIFGDLFQLLDRKNGVSEYPIKADQDLADYLKRELGTDSEGIRNDELRLPANLYIWATMNTSDQSLFPIDSAFKRRWDWEYVPIKYSNKDWLIEIGDKKYNWVDFQKVINGKIFDATESEDKQLGDYFVKADTNNIISAKLLLNKVIFYLWNDVCKDGDGDIFKVNTDLDYSKELDHSKDEDITFSQFFQGTDLKLQQWMRYLGIEPIQSVDDSSKEDEERQAQIEAGTEENDAQKVKYTKPIYKTLVESIASKLDGQKLSFFPNGLEWAFTNMPKSYTRMSLSFDGNAKSPVASAKLWIPAATGYKQNIKCITFLRDNGGEAIVSEIAKNHGLAYEEIGGDSHNPDLVHGWKILLPMSFSEESASTDAETLYQLLSDMHSAFDPIITDFQNNK